MPQRFARIGSQARPQPLQFWKEESSRPSAPANCRFTQVVPQHRCPELHIGEQSPPPGGGIMVPLSAMGGAA